jgi:hypothetical protein
MWTEPVQGPEVALRRELLGTVPLSVVFAVSDNLKRNTLTRNLYSISISSARWQTYSSTQNCYWCKCVVSATCVQRSLPDIYELWTTVFWEDAPCSLVEVHRRFRGACWVLTALVLEAASISKTSANLYQNTQRNNPENTHVHTRRRENLKPHHLRIALTLVNPRGRSLQKLFFGFPKHSLHFIEP